MYAYGFRSERLTSGYGQYAAPPPTKKNPVTTQEATSYFSQLDNFVRHLAHIFKTYLPLQAKQAFDIRSEWHAPTIADTHAGNLTVTHAFQSAPHIDPDVSYAIGAWFDFLKTRKGFTKRGEFTFPEYRIAVELHNGICIAWHSAYAQHATVACDSQQCTRIGTSIQLNKTLCTKAKRLWSNHHQSSWLLIHLHKY